jgi:two-component system NtrC family sensor kinase
VIKDGKVWGDRAFVVNDWYITAYKPIVDPEGKIIGAIYTGVLEAPYREPQKIIMLFFFIALAITAIASLILMFFYTKRLIRPIENVINTSKRIMDGDLSARCKIRPPGEIGILCKTIDQMAESMEENMRKMQEDTKIQLMQSEKLASVGRLAAGVAHEINNPLTGVLTFAHFLKEKKTNDKDDLHDINVIIQETTRVRDIIRGLLDFARQTPPNRSMISVNETIQLLLKLVKGQKEFRNILIVENYQENLPELYADKNQLQQVFLNLILNAGEAISGPGTITITTVLSNNNIVITFADTGCGISSDDLDRIFDPFFTTKPVGKGTGLGLSVSYGIIQQHGGIIKCESKQGEGTTFKIYFSLNSK